MRLWTLNNGQREDIDAADAMNEGRGLCRVIVWAAALGIIVGICLFAAIGCSTFGGVGEGDTRRSTTSPISPIGSTPTTESRKVVRQQCCPISQAASSSTCRSTRR